MEGGATRHVHGVVVPTFESSPSTGKRVVERPAREDGERAPVELRFAWLRAERRLRLRITVAFAAWARHAKELA